MSEAFERAARALYDATNGIDGDQLAGMLIMDDRITGASAEERRLQVMAVCRHAVRAVLEAIRAPDAAMTEALAEEARQQWGGIPDWADLSDEMRATWRRWGVAVWRAGLDEVLRDA